MALRGLCSLDEAVSSDASSLLKPDEAPTLRDVVGESVVDQRALLTPAPRTSDRETK